MSSSFPVQGPTFDERTWIIHIRRAIHQDLDEEEDENIPVSIFDVPKTLKLLHPDSYMPQQVALGPYHHSRPELYEIERYKLSAARRFQQQLQPLQFQDHVDHLIKFEPLIRACYHKHLNINGETLVWIMAVDMCFLLEFLNIFTVKKGNVSPQFSTRMSYLVNITRQKSGHNALVGDIVMLENQIPLFLLRKTLEFQLGSLDEARNMFYSMLMEFCKEILPFETLQELPSVHQVMDCAHLLDILYRLIVPKSERSSEITADDEEQAIQKDGENEFASIISKLKQGPVSLIQRILTSKPIELIFSLPCKVISNLPVVIVVKQFEYFCFSQEKEIKNEGNENRDFSTRSPLLEEIAIPSVTELSKAGIKFSATSSGVFSITFDVNNVTLYLPTVKLNCNTEVALRNLVAYEACNESGPLILARYMELMNGIIDDKDDVKILRERGIILNHLKSDQDVANLWNGMTKSIRLTKVPFMDKVIEDVNNYYNGRWKVRMGKFLGRYTFSSWKHFCVWAAVFVLFFMGMQVFSSMFSLGRLFLQQRRML